MPAMSWRKLPPGSVAPRCRWMPFCFSSFAVLLLVAVLSGFRDSWSPDWGLRRGREQQEQAAREPSSAAGSGRVTYVQSLKRDSPTARSQSVESRAGNCCPSPLLQGRRKISCNNVEEMGWFGSLEPTQEPWPVCLDNTYNLAQQIHRKQCRVYSVGLGSGDKHFDVEMAKAGCEVHYFDPSIKEAHFQKSQGYWHHRMSIDWRDPNPAVVAQIQRRTTKKLGTIMNEFGHRKIDVLKADLESAEWKILENLILENVIEEIGQLVFAIHLHWPGFEVSGDDSDVVRYWYSLLKELELRSFKLFRSYKNINKPQIFLRKQAFNASSSYILSWVNTQWRQY